MVDLMVDHSVANLGKQWVGSKAAYWVELKAASLAVRMVAHSVEHWDLQMAGQTAW